MQQWKQYFDQNIRSIIESRCLDCHNGEDADGGFDLARFPDGESAAAQSEIWETVGKKIRLNEMPPEGSPQLNDPEKGKFYAWLDSRPQTDLCSKLATDETQAWYRGVVMSRRLTRTEYLNAISDIVGLSVDPQFSIPSDGAGGEGFDTNGDSLFTSPIHVEQYLTVANQMVDRLLTDPRSPKHADDTPDRIDRAQERLFGQMVDVAGDSSMGTTWDQLQSLEDESLIPQLIQRFGWLAWRRPLQQQEQERLHELYKHGRQQGLEQLAALGLPLKATLVSPNFLFVVETETEKGGVQKLTPHQLATRMALLIWSSAPDEVLLQAADRGELETKEQVIAAARRMLKDPRSRALGENFGLQWLGLSNFLTTARPDGELYPEYDSSLAADLHEEAVRTVAAIFQEDRPTHDLIAADWVLVNRRLASHYGLEWPETIGTTTEADANPSWLTLPVEDSQRGGVVTLGATLVSTSYPRRTSPVLRGRWLLEELLGARVPPPPPGVPALEESEANHAATLRERLEVHRKNPECAACHNRMDPLGFGLENFDALGRWRTEDQGQAIDATGKLPSGDTFNGPEELKQIVLKRSADFDRHLTRKLLGFALGRSLNKFDDCVINDCMKALAENEHRGSVLIETIVTSYPFQHRYFKAEESNNE